PRNARPRRRAADGRDELAAPHSITSSTRVGRAEVEQLGVTAVGAKARRSLTGCNPPTDLPDHNRIFPSQTEFFCFMADHQAFACTQRVFHLVRTDFDFQCLAAIRYREPKYCVFLRCATWPER